MNLLGNFSQGLTAGEKFLTPSIEYYKNVANQYKKTLSSLSINQPGNPYRQQEIAIGNLESARGTDSQPYLFQKDLRAGGGSGLTGEEKTSLIPAQQLHNEYSTNSILKNAKAERLMLDAE